MRQSIVLGGGCFWGMEELFRQQAGVIDTEVGYAGGRNENPVYEYHPGHAEAIKIDYDDARTSLDALLDYFFRIHDPTTKNRQGNDIGTSYRSVIFYESPEQKQATVRAIARAQPNWANEIVTTLEELPKFYSAEAYHQDYLQKNPGGYTCHFERSF